MDFLRVNPLPPLIEEPRIAPQEYFEVPPAKIVRMEDVLEYAKLKGVPESQARGEFFADGYTIE